MNLLQSVRSSIDKLDRSFGFIYRNIRWIAYVLTGLMFALVLKWAYGRLRAHKETPKVVKYLISGSARHIDSALSLRSSNIMEAYEHAIYGNVMAQAAKDLVDDKKALSSELNVDVYAYLDYTNQVLSQIKTSLKSK